MKAEKTPSKTEKVIPPNIDAYVSFPYHMIEAPARQIQIAPADILFPTFDSKFANTPLDEKFVESIRKQGILQPPLVTPVRAKATNVNGYLVIAGRQRIRAAIELKMPSIVCNAKSMTLRQAVLAAGAENMQRKNLSFWDQALYLRSLQVEWKLTPSEICNELQITQSDFSQTMAAFKLDLRVQTMAAEGKLGVGTKTKVRHLVLLKDFEQQYKVACMAAEMTADQLEVYVAKLRNQAEKPRSKAQTTKQASVNRKPNEVAFLPKRKVIDLLNWTANQLGNARQQETDPVRLARLQGRQEGIEVMAGFRPLPKRLGGE